MLRRLVIAALAVFSCVTSASTDTSQTLSKLLEDIWHYELQSDPVLGSSMGAHEYDHLLPDLSPEALARNHQQFSLFADKLNALSRDELSRTEQINLDMQLYRLNNIIDKYRFRQHYVPFTSETGFHTQLTLLPKRARLASVADYENYLTRLSAIPTYVEQNIYWLEQGIKAGMVQPKAVMKGFDDSVASFFQTTPEQSVFYAPFNNLEKFPDDVQAQLRAKAIEVIQNDVFSAYETFHRFLQDTYIPNAKTDIAAVTWPDGKAYYQNRARYYTTTDLTADEIHNIGLQEVARIRADMQKVVDSVEFDGDINDFIQFLRTDEQFYAKTPLELIKHASYYAKQMDAQLPKLFNKLPRTPYGVEPVPANIAPKYTTGRYIAPTRDDEPGYYWVNTYALDKRPLYAIPALTLHEAVPGHHLQNALAREMTDLPPVRRFTYISAFGEGWGLYSEYLGKEVGIYQNAYDEFGRLSYDMWRACRLVVDTGMHVKGWTRQQAIDYMLENTALSELNVRSEIDRYISWPAQALAYKIGELEIRRLRAQAEKELGEKFDIRAFHDAVLEYGSVPLSTLRENIQVFIDKRKAR